MKKLLILSLMFLCVGLFMGTQDAHCWYVDNVSGLWDDNYTQTEVTEGFGGWEWDIDIDDQLNEGDDVTAATVSVSPFEPGTTVDITINDGTQDTVTLEDVVVNEDGAVIISGDDLVDALNGGIPNNVIVTVEGGISTRHGAPDMLAYESLPEPATILSLLLGGLGLAVKNKAWLMLGC